MDESRVTRDSDDLNTKEATSNENIVKTEVPTLIIKALADALIFNNPLSFWIRFRSGKSLEERKIELIKDLSQTGFDPMIFDSLLSNEINRKLKVNFGVAFIILTLVFTAASYSVIVLNSVYHWGISQTSITALIIETPIQLIGLLYIVARNLFPSSNKKIENSGTTV